MKLKWRHGRVESTGGPSMSPEVRHIINSNSSPWVTELFIVNC